MEEIHKNASYKILQITLPAGKIMPRHYATSDAFIMVVSGEARLSLTTKEQILQPGATFPIPAREPHTLEILSDFRAFVVLAADANIEFNEK
ncbi:hypothetical protein AAE02nite_27020 [Adhaeribacter aerolatus]|uniref:Cupin type-2 domain-containing protein n=1 Tax=Adhaeribacter aerolatus TaxID=670289 RepID=A0A512AZ93_9BACT|nr:cupin domain-containing protein [Adhaeribacter aerolatus]GEO05038.1 hypothetical protein AAE02nite_27020 [Adhaeribacter aerolatus]